RFTAVFALPKNKLTPSSPGLRRGLRRSDDHPFVPIDPKAAGIVVVVRSRYFMIYPLRSVPMDHLPFSRSILRPGLMACTRNIKSRRVAASVESNVLDVHIFTL